MFFYIFLKNILILIFLAKSTEKTSRHDQSNRFDTTDSCYRMTPTTQPKQPNPSIVLCWISFELVTVSLVVQVQLNEERFNRFGDHVGREQ